MSDPFFTAFEAHLPGMQESLAGPHSQRNLTQTVVDAIDQLTAYEEFVRAARSQKLAGKRFSRSFESAVLVRAVEAQAAVDDLARAVARALEYERQAGTFERGAEAMRQALFDEGGQRVGDLLGRSFDNASVQAHLAKLPIDDTVIDRLRRSIDSIDADVIPDGDGLSVSWASGATRTVRFQKSATTGQLVQALRAGSAEHTGLPGLGTVDFVDMADVKAVSDSWTIADLIVASTESARSEMRGHVTRTRQVGLSAHQGASGLVVVAIVIGLLIAVGLLIKGFCNSSYDSEEDKDECFTNVLLFLFVTLLVAGGSSKSSQTAAISSSTFSNPSPA